MKEGLDSLKHLAKACGASILMNRAVDAVLAREIQPDLLVWATGAVQNILEIKGLDNQHVMTSIEYLQGKKEIKGPRVLVIGVGQVGIEITEKLGNEGYDVVAIELTDQIGSMMEMITKKLVLMRIKQLEKVIVMPHTTVKEFKADIVEMEKDGEMLFLEPFQSVILASGMRSAPGPDEEIVNAVTRLELIGDAREVHDIFSAVHAGYDLALKY
jgi:pyruvate/2-oxoglutarate dehydrogenase complex dihydrolipoamide dehydrogenase (E3) component